MLAASGTSIPLADVVDRREVDVAVSAEAPVNP
jgi:hypothetical protein